MAEPAYDARSTVQGVAARGDRGGVPAAHPGREPAIDIGPDADRVLVMVRGELGLDVGQGFRRALKDALGRSAQGIDLDLSGVGFCDCSALNTLISLRERARAQGKTIVVRATSPMSERLLALTGTRSLFSAETPGGPEAHEAGPPLPAVRHGEPGDGTPAEDTEQDLRIEVVQLRRAMQTRPAIDLARGILMASFGLTPEQAWSVLVIASQKTNTKLHHVARDVVTAVHGDPLPETVQKHLAVAVTEVRASADGTGAP
ncbi:antitermination regulator [Streptomyces sp. NTH33]|uniref:ANTAR domain-containing protein n=1 Tax=Streptomyces sp. NTH33 TaxID=1735453 RepID=UPI000DA9AE73|nr:ANTAR domain-containing protein [Streptomyces sp. NTH33]PZH19783.1 antitermination regulator [Streptomyces sp. NTH33]